VYGEPLLFEQKTYFIRTLDLRSLLALALKHKEEVSRRFVSGRPEPFKNSALLLAVTKLRGGEWQMVVIRKQKEKSEGENELLGIVPTY